MIQNRESTSRVCICESCARTVSNQSSGGFNLHYLYQTRIGSGICPMRVNRFTFTPDALFICSSKTDLTFVFRFSSLLKTNLICDFRFWFLDGLLLENWFEVRMSFLRDCENRINASVIWNSRSPHRGWSRYCGAFQFIISPFLLPGRLPGTRNSNLFFNNKPRKNENQLRFSKLMPKRKTKSKSVLVLDSTHSTPRLLYRIDYLDYRSWHFPASH